MPSVFSRLSSCLAGLSLGLIWGPSLGGFENTWFDCSAQSSKFLGLSENCQCETISENIGDNWHPNFPPNQNIQVLRQTLSEAKQVSNVLGPNEKLLCHAILTSPVALPCLCNSRDAASCRSSGLSSSISACATKDRCGHLWVPTNPVPMSWHNRIGYKKLEYIEDIRG